ncbi:hypothetical protein Ancab_035455 [Ancistrocladus abbreviatus]
MRQSAVELNQGFLKLIIHSCQFSDVACLGHAIITLGIPVATVFLNPVPRLLRLFWFEHLAAKAPSGSLLPSRYQPLALTCYL